MKTIKLFFVTIILLLSGSAGMFGNSNVNLVEGQPKTRLGVEAVCTNYSISYNVNAEGEAPYSIYQARCKQAWAYRLERESDGQFVVVDEVAKKAYLLDNQEKTGVFYPFNSNFAYRGFDLPHLFLHESMEVMYDDSFKKTGDSEIIAGRPATIYSYEYSDGFGTFWIDNQYGFLLKYVQVGSNDMQVEVTEFIDGGITLADMVDLSEYNITKAE